MKLVISIRLVIIHISMESKIIYRKVIIDYIKQVMFTVRPKKECCYCYGHKCWRSRNSQTFTTGTAMEYFWHDHLMLQFLNDWRRKQNKKSFKNSDYELPWKEIFLQTPVRLIFFIHYKIRENVEIPPALVMTLENPNSVLFIVRQMFRHTDVVICVSLHTCKGQLFDN